VRQREHVQSIQADLAIIGGGLGGCAAAIAAARLGCRVVMTEESRWIGGQLTSEAIPPDEHPWIEHYGSTNTYREFRSRVREYYRRHLPLSDAAKSRLVFAALRGVPFTGLPYASKVEGFLNDLGVEESPLGLVGIGQLIARIDHSWDSRAQISQNIRTYLPELQKSARQTNQLILELLHKETRQHTRIA